MEPLHRQTDTSKPFLAEETNVGHVAYSFVQSVRIRVNWEMEISPVVAPQGLVDVQFRTTKQTEFGCVQITNNSSPPDELGAPLGGGLAFIPKASLSRLDITAPPPVPEAAIASSDHIVVTASSETAEDCTVSWHTEWRGTVDPPSLGPGTYYVIPAALLDEAPSAVDAQVEELVLPILEVYEDKRLAILLAPTGYPGCDLVCLDFRYPERRGVRP